jgi:hypothetical protein
MLPKTMIPRTMLLGTTSLDSKISKKLSQRTTLTFQAVISAGMTKNQLAEPAVKEPKTTVDSATAKTDKSEVEKKEAEPPEVSKPAKLKYEKPTDALPYMKNTVDGLEEDNPVSMDLKASLPS